MIRLLDCTLRDGGYYNNWDFGGDLVNRYLDAVQAAGIDVVELGFRSLKNDSFKGPFAYSTDEVLKELTIPPGLEVAVMVNASELVGQTAIKEAISALFPEPAAASPVGLVRIACHLHEFPDALPASRYLKDLGYKVGFNLMQISDRSAEEIQDLLSKAKDWPIDIFYLADSMGALHPSQIHELVNLIRNTWQGDIGVHTHDNLGLALQNTLEAMRAGVTWVDATITGMGRGPGNAKTEELVIEVSQLRNKKCNLVPLMGLIREYFKPMQNEYGWGTNPYYYLAGKYGIHPTYIQEMLSDSRYTDEDILAAIDHLRVEGGKKYRADTLDAARHFFHGPVQGHWSPAKAIAGREVLVLGAGPSIEAHRNAIERFIRKNHPYVMALNTQSRVSPELIDVRLACHPVRLLADCETHAHLPQPLITPASMLPSEVRHLLGDKELLDFGIVVEPDSFGFYDNYCVVPNPLVAAYALAVATSGHASKILVAGFDGYGADDPRTHEMQRLLTTYEKSEGAVPIVSVTPTSYRIQTKSIYAM